MLNFYFYSVVLAGAEDNTKRGSEPPVREHVAHGGLRALRQRQVQRKDDGALLQEEQPHQQQPSASAGPADTAHGAKVIDPNCQSKRHKYGRN